MYKKQQKKPPIVSDVVRNAHHAVIVISTQETRTKVTDLFGQLNASVETRDYSKMRDVLREIDAHVGTLLDTTMSAARSCGYRYVPVEDSDDDDDDDIGPMKSPMKKRSY